jgi:hypothetical protein
MKLLTSLFFMVWAVIGLIRPQPVFAHILQTDGTIGAVLHIDPADDPLVGEPASFFFEFKDRAGKFSVDTCSCVFWVMQNGTTVFSQPLTGPTVAYTFPKRGAYQVGVTGEPLEAGSFSPFRLAYDLRVSRTGNKQPSGGVQPTMVLYIFGAAGSVACILLISKKIRRR